MGGDNEHGKTYSTQKTEENHQATRAEANTISTRHTQPHTHLKAPRQHITGK